MIKNDLKVDYKAVNTLIFYDKNSRTHSNSQVRKIVKSIKEFGFTNPILIDENNNVIAGHGRLLACKKMRLKTAPCITLKGLSDTQRKAYVIADNSLALNADWDLDTLKSEVNNLISLDFDVDVLGLDDLDDLDLELPDEDMGEVDEIPTPPTEPKSKRGDIYLLGDNRLMCGDSTNADDVARLMNGEKATLLHSDPPYGMGKENEGVANDNLYNDKLDAFQMKWWKAFRPHITDNASAYIWGNAEGLWRLWYKGGLGDSEQLAFRNEIVWDKSAYGARTMGTEGLRCYSPTSERCLFFMIGGQGFNNNADNYYKGFDPIRNYLVSERAKAGLSYKQIKEVTNETSSHYFAKSQWGFPTEKHYQAIQKLANGKAFKRDYEDFKRDYYDTRAYFDNTHANMTEIWSSKPVLLDERHGHATPKPVELMQRIMKSSLVEGGLCVELFGGSGSTLIGAVSTGRRCHIMEIEPKYIDTIIARWEIQTGKKAILE